MDLKERIEQAKNIVFFGGAGVSTESGIPDFRSDNGLYKKKYRYSAERMVSHSFFMISVPQSSSLIITSWATSTKRRVK